MNDADDPQHLVDRSRRRFLGCIVAAGTVACGSSNNAGTCHVSNGTLPTVASLPVGDSIRTTGLHTYILVHDSDGFYAFDAHCTHRGTPLPCPNGSGVIVCPNHHAHYDLDGNITRGPDNGESDTTDLPHYPITFGADGTIVVDTGHVEPDRERRFNPESR